ncbi:MAG: penicillin acylase family protein [Caldilineaceae bacterium]|nr:penicillin acylase family protein [Caldilineaceae bacterium]
MTIAISIIVILLLLLVALIGGFYVYIYYFRIQRPVPTLTGDAPLPGLDADVEILRDKHAVPHIYAQGEADVWRAQGYIHAQERFWQMEQARRTAYGTLAEIFGAAALDADRFSRIIGLRMAAEAEAAALDDATRQVTSWYAEGVNAYLEAHAGRVAAELSLLRVEPAPWTVTDTVAVLKVFAWGQCLNWESELTRLRLALAVGPIRAAELEPDAPASTPIVLEGMGSAEVTRMLHTAGLMLNQYEQLKQWLGVVGEGQGSNSWVVAPARSVTRQALLAADPHQPLQIPGLWYENALHSADGALDVAGASLPGVPGVFIGHNAAVAWGVTNALVDVQDLCLERLHPEKRGVFAVPGGWEPARVRTEEIAVRRGATHVEKVVHTRNGPLITGLLQDADDAAQMQLLPLSLRWTGQEPGTTLRALLRLNKAGDWDAFDAALADWCEPPVNVTYADTDGHIGYAMAGRVPLRSDANLGLIPAPGWSDDAAWTRLIPHAELPKLRDPASGVIVTANNKMVGDDYPYFLGVEFMPGWRAARIEEMLGKKARHTLRDMEEIQLDVRSKYAEALAPWIGLVDSDDPWEKTALNAMRTWSYHMEPDSTAALVFHYTVLELLQMVFGDKVGAARDGFLGETISPLFPTNGFMSRAELRLLQLIDEHETSVWYADAATDTPRTRDELLQQAFTRAVRTIRATVGDSARKWDWGRSHQIRYVHPLGSARFLRGFFNRGPFPIGGDGTTPLQTRHAPRLPLGLVQITPSYRQLVDVGNWDRGMSVTTAGQSGHPFSDHYDDQMTMFREGVYHRMPWSRAAVDEAAVYRMRLVRG